MRFCDAVEREKFERAKEVMELQQKQTKMADSSGKGERGAEAQEGNRRLEGDDCLEGQRHSRVGSDERQSALYSGGGEDPLSCRERCRHHHRFRWNVPSDLKTLCRLSSGDRRLPRFTTESPLTTQNASRSPQRFLLRRRDEREKTNSSPLPTIDPTALSIRLSFCSLNIPTF